jgi:hypothetical protein
MLDLIRKARLMLGSNTPWPLPDMMWWKVNLISLKDGLDFETPSGPQMANIVESFQVGPSQQSGKKRDPEARFLMSKKPAERL